MAGVKISREKVKKNKKLNDRRREILVDAADCRLALATGIFSLKTCVLHDI